MKKGVYFMAAAIVMIFCDSGVGDAATYTPDEMLVVSGFTVEITGTGCGSNSDSAWGTARGGSRNTATARIRNSSSIGKSPVLGGTQLSASPITRLRSGKRSPSPHVRWKRMRSKALIRGKRMFLVNSIGKKYRAPTGTYKLYNGNLVTVRNGQILPKTGCP